MVHFGTLVGQYNASALTLADTANGYVALDVKSRILVNHGTSSFQIGNGNEISPEFLDIMTWGAASAGTENGFMPVGIYKSSPTNLGTNDGDIVPFQFDANGRLRVDAEVSISTGSDKAEDSAHASGDIGAFTLSIRIDDLTADNSALLAGADGDYQGLFTNLKGELYVKDTDVASALTDLTHNEDDAHVSGDKGVMALGVANEAEVNLSSADGDYTPIATDRKGRVKIVGAVDINTIGTVADVGVDEAGDGEESVVYHATNFTTIATIAVGAGITLFIEAFNASCDVLTEFRLAIYDDTTLTTVIRKLPVPENIGANEWTFPRVREVVGAADRTVVLQARCMRAGKTSLCGGGINAYTI